VLLLCVAVQSKENEKIVGAIMSMDVDTQRDIMFYIESTLAQVKSHALVAGTFTSGTGRQDIYTQAHESDNTIYLF